MPRRPTEDGPVSLDMDSPYQISKIVGEFYAIYYHRQHGLPIVRARFQNVYGPGEILGAGRWRGTPRHGVAQRDADLRLQGAQGRGAAARERGACHPRLHLRRRHRRGLMACARARARPARCTTWPAASRRRFASWPRAINETDRQSAPLPTCPGRPWDRSGRRYGSRRRRLNGSVFERRCRSASGLRRPWPGRERTCRPSKPCDRAASGRRSPRMSGRIKTLLLEANGTHWVAVCLDTLGGGRLTRRADAPAAIAQVAAAAEAVRRSLCHGVLHR